MHPVPLCWAGVLSVVNDNTSSHFRASAFTALLFVYLFIYLFIYLLLQGDAFVHLFLCHISFYSLYHLHQVCQASKPFEVSFVALKIRVWGQMVWNSKCPSLLWELRSLLNVFGRALTLRYFMTVRLLTFHYSSGKTCFMCLVKINK